MFRLYVATENSLSSREATKFFVDQLPQLGFEGLALQDSNQDFEVKFESLLPVIRKTILQDFRGLESPKGLDYKTIWSHFQKTSVGKVKEIVKKEFPTAQIHATKTKSGFPDIKITYESKDYAVDIKSGESGREPWYDIARLDTIFEKRLNKYAEEYDIVIKYDKDTGKVENVFFEPMYKTVGKDPKSGGVKFRPYDGKLRPKSWEMFETGKAYWGSKEDFISAVRKSMYYRRRKYIEDWWPTLPNEEKAKLRKMICEQKSVPNCVEACAQKIEKCCT